MSERAFPFVEHERYGIVGLISMGPAPLTLSDFDFPLPDELIAQAPVRTRDRSRLLVLDRAAGTISHRVFGEIGGLLRPGDLLVLNDTRVFPCRLVARKTTGGKAEVFLLEELGVNRWRVMLKGGAAAGRRLEITDGITADVDADNGDGTWRVRFTGVQDIRTVLPAVGQVPLPPYIRREPSPEDRERYQTVYAAREGAVAAPTAGLHFTNEVLEELRGSGIETVTLTLHVGPGTFLPVRTERLDRHHMHAERYEVPDPTAKAINSARAQGRRIIAVGTTVVRVLETACGEDGALRSGAGSTDLFILPGHRFSMTGGMLTNFHLPRSTLLMLVAAFAGRELVLEAYRIAVRERYRFYSYGDAMLVL